jgi:hypothetical protein
MLIIVKNNDYLYINLSLKIRMLITRKNKTQFILTLNDQQLIVTEKKGGWILVHDMDNNPFTMEGDLGNLVYKLYEDLLIKEEKILHIAKINLLSECILTDALTHTKNLII